MNTEVHPLKEILESLARSVERQIDGSSVGVQLKSPATGNLHHIAAPTLPPAFTAAMDRNHGGPFAAQSRRPDGHEQNVLVSDIARDPSWSGFREQALSEGLRACWCIDVLAADGTLLGVLAAYIRRVREITNRETRVCEQFAHLASVILERKRSDDALKSMNHRLQESLDEKESLLKEVHHRVKNNLQLISSMLNLQASRIADPAVAELFGESRNRVRSMALVHENLYRAGNFSRISMMTHLGTLSASLARAYGLNGSNIELVTEVQDILLALDLAIPVGLIVNELTSNALKHAFPGGRPGRVVIGFRRAGPNLCELVVRDNGVGTAVMIDPHRGDSLGLQLVHDLTAQLHGKIHVDRDGGTAIAIVFAADDCLDDVA
jgi:two-component sensor histidine kinase